MSFFGEPESDTARPRPDDEGASVTAPDGGAGGEPSPPADAALPLAGRGPRTRRLAIEVVQTLVLAALIFFAVRGIAQNFRVEGRSMEPGLDNGQYLLVNKAVYARPDFAGLLNHVPFVHSGHTQHFIFHGPRRGDVIVFRAPQDPSRDFIKRVIGVPGDKVRVADRAVYVNGVRLDEPYISAAPDYTYKEQVVPAGAYFVLGDNRNNSSDSHLWGFVPAENIIGQAVLRYWPSSDFGGVGNHRFDLGFIQMELP